MPRSAAGLLAFVVLLYVATAAGAGKRRIAVLQPDGELLRAISIALLPWGVETTGSDMALPESSQPEAVQTASRLAEQLGVEALVWVTRAERGSFLWVFDNRGDVTTRALIETPPFDSAAAAAVALSVKTILRSSGVAPPEERRQAPAPSTLGKPGTAPLTEPDAAPLTSPRVAPLTGPGVAAELGAGGRWIDENDLDFRVELAAVLWLAWARRLGVSLELSWGPGVQIDDPDYRGRYREWVAGAKARLRVFDFQRFSAIVSLGGAAHWATLEGSLGERVGASASSVNRLKGSVDFQTAVSLRITRSTYLGASLGAAYLPAYQRYLVQGRPVFSPWPLTPSLAGYYGVELF